MRRVLVSISLLFPAIGLAQPGATEPGSQPPPPAAPSLPDPAAPMGPSSTAPLATNDPRTPALARGAHNAAARGDCIGAAALGAQIYRVDPVYHQAVIRNDPVITSCRPAPRSVAVTETDASDEPTGPARAGTPPTDAGSIAGQVVIGGLFGLGGGILGAYAGAGLECSGGCGGEFGGLGGAILGGMIGLTLFTPIGVNLAGDSSTVEGSFGAALGGSVVGMLVGTAIVATADGDGGAVVLFLASPLIGATIGYNMSRRYKAGTARISMMPVPTRIADGMGLSLATGSF